MKRNIVRANKKRETFNGKFYVLDYSNEEGEWWLVRLIHNHYTIVAVGSKDKMKECIHDIIFRYKDFNRLLKKLKKCEKGMYSKESYLRRAKQYKLYEKGDLRYDLENFISNEEKALADFMDKRKRKRPIVNKKVEKRPKDKKDYGVEVKVIRPKKKRVTIL